MHQYIQIPGSSKYPPAKWMQYCVGIAPAWDVARSAGRNSGLRRWRTHESVDRWKPLHTLEHCTDEEPRNGSQRDRLGIVFENRVALQSYIDKAILDTVLGFVKGRKMDGEE